LPRFFDYTTEVIYTKTERVSSLDDLEHPMVRNAMKMLDMHELHIAYDADLPARTGLGTSSTFAVGLLNAFYCLKGKFVTKEQLAKDAIHLERDLCGEAGGWQDQIAASYGGLNRIDFDGDHFTVKPLMVPVARKNALDKNLLLFFTGFTRFSAEIQKETVASLGEREKYLEEMLSLVDEAENILVDRERDLDDFGRLLDKEWQLKRNIGSTITNDGIDALYAKGIAAGALGGKLLGAGGGGFLLFYVTKDKQPAVREALKDLMEVPFRFEKDGTTVIHYAPEVFDVTEVVEK
jgi:D-glycero-alpha-D-manno-heptose-7-phosphate kinase